MKYFKIENVFTCESRLQLFAFLCLAMGVAATAQADTFTVNSTADPGDGVCDQTCTFRDSILAANANPGQDTIDFSGIVLPGDTVPVTIHLTGGLPVISDSVIMDATITETRELPGNPARRPGVELHLGFAAPVIGTIGLPFFPNGLTINGPDASGSVIRGFVVNGINRAVPALCIFPWINPDPGSPGAPSIGYCSYAISIFGANEVTVAGNYLNLDSDGEALVGSGITAVSLVDASGSVIGGDRADDRNVMTSRDFGPGDDNGSYNMIQVYLLGWGTEAFGIPREFRNNRISGNYLGMSASGIALNPLVRGIYMRSIFFEDAPGLGPVGWGPQCADPTPDPCVMEDNTIEGNTLTSRGWQSTFALFGAQRNTVVSDNTVFNTTDLQGHVEVFETNTGIPEDMVLTGNRFGVDANGTPSTGPTFVGIQVGEGTGILIENNVITGSFLDGVGLGLSSETSLFPVENVTISRNSIYGNCISGDPLCKGLSFLPQGLYGNDFLDLDSGPNHLQNHPVLLEIKPGKGKGATKIKAELDSSSNQAYLVEFFSNSSLNASSRGEGERFLGQKQVVTDKDGHVEFTFQYNPNSNGEVAGSSGVTFITATATRKHCEPQEPGCLYGSTSEFSPACEWNVAGDDTVDCLD